MNTIDKIYSLEEIIKINEDFDKYYLMKDTQALNELIQKIDGSGLVDSAFKKYFFELSQNEDIKGAIWFFEIILPFVSLDYLKECVRQISLSDNFPIDGGRGVLDVLCSFLSEDYWVQICMECKPFQIIWLAQNIYRDVSFYWDRLQANELDNIINYFFMSSFSKEHKSANFSILLNSLFNRLPLNERVNTVRFQIFKMCSLVESQSNVSMPVLIDMFALLYNCAGINALKDCDDLLNWINTCVIGDKFKDLRDFVFNYHKYPNDNVLKHHDFFLSLSESLNSYFLYVDINLCMDELATYQEEDEDGDFKL